MNRKFSYPLEDFFIMFNPFLCLSDDFNHIDYNNKLINSA